jgi:hypothetical protein
MQVRSVAIDPESAFVKVTAVGLGNYAWSGYDPTNVAKFLSTSSAEVV